MNNIKQLYKELVKAKEDKTNAESEISCVESAYYSDGKEYACLHNIVVAGDSNSTIMPAVCESFNYGKVCENKDCPINEKNVRYVEAVKNLKQARGKFFRALFGRNK